MARGVAEPGAARAVLGSALKREYATLPRRERGRRLDREEARDSLVARALVRAERSRRMHSAHVVAVLRRRRETAFSRAGAVMRKVRGLVGGKRRAGR